MWGRTYPHVILLIFANIFKASCEGTSSLTFVIDDTGSMQNDINLVTRSANRIMDIVFNEKASLINNMVLVTFNDPDSQVRVVTKDRHTFKRALQSVYAHNMDPTLLDCMEPSMQGLLLALDRSLPGSYIYVFTDASAKDYYKSALVKEMCQRKQSQIVFVLTGKCLAGGEVPFRVYYDIADACSGLAFYVDSDGANQVIRTIEETIKGNKTVMTTKTVPAGTSADIPFVIDDQTDYAIVSVSGTSVSLSIRGPRARQERVMWHRNGKVIKLSDATPGRYVATVMGHTSTSVVIVGRTDFHFTHGFSALVPKTLGDTTPQPIAETDVYLSISITDPNHLVNIKSAQILDEKEKPIGKLLHLTQKSKDFYITKPFVAPSQRFKISVQGTVITSGKSISRINKIPITPQDPPKQPDKMKPTANIEEGKSIEVEYNSSVTLTCKVSGYPRPQITWVNNKGATMQSSNSIFQEPYEYISYMNLPNALEDSKCICYAVNEKGKDSKTIHVSVKDPLVVKAAPSGVTKVFYGSEGTITCDIRSSLPMQILWYYANQITGVKRQITSSDKYQISSDGTQLKITQMIMDLVGRYTCKASLIHSIDIQKTYNTIVEVVGLISPKITGPTTKRVIKGASAVLECSITNGLPVPKISWQFKSRSSTEYTHLSDASLLHISTVSDHHAGQYKCLAENVIGKDKHVINLIIQELPQITSRPTSAYQGVEGDALLRIPCITTGLPKPIISWKLNGHAISTNAKYSIEDDALIIRNPTIGDTHSYTCEAKNEVGTETATFRTHILQGPTVSGMDAEKVNIGTPTNIACQVGKGEPKPKITWQFMNKSGSTFVPIAGSDTVLHISSAEKSHAGRYKCVAQNIVGKVEHVTTLIVQESPKILTSPTSDYEGIEGDALLRIPCVATGFPKPINTWKLNGHVISANAKYSMEDDALIIRNPMVDDTRSYTCEAKNEVGTETATFQTHILQAPAVSGVKVKKVKIGTPINIECQVGKGEPKPKITWQFMDISGSTFVPIAGSDTVLYISSAEKSHAGRYKCVAQNRVGKVEHVTTLTVQEPPKIVSSPTSDYEGIEGDALLRIPCVATGFPKPIITWKLNGHVISANAKYSIEDDALIIRNPTLGDTRSYTCEAINEAGTETATFQTHILQVPAVSGIDPKKVKIGTSTNIECQVVKGEPKPKITWQFLGKSGSTFVPIAGYDTVLHISSAKESHAGRYKCVAQNRVGKVEHVTTLTVQEPPKITSSPTSVYEGKEGDALLRIPCVATGLPNPIITWKLNDRVISPNAKYIIKDGTLIINNPTVNDTRSYTCEAKNEVDTDTVNFQIHILQAPKLSGVPSMTVRSGTPVNIECKVVKGEPKPKIAWLFMKKSISTFAPIAGLDNVLRITRVDRKDAGSYKCVAQNEVGDDEHITALTVEFPPIITSNFTLVYEGLEEDLALRIPCDVIGIPQPVVSWKLRGDVITPSAKYAVADGALIIKDPKQNDSASYICTATNYLGSISAEFKAKIEEGLDSYGIEHHIYLLTGETKKLNCETFSSKSHSIRWFTNGVYNKTDDNYELVHATPEMDGNYTCRASDKHGNTHTYTYAVDVGYPPSNPYASSEVNEWRGDVTDILTQCDADAKPPANVQWMYNDQVLSDRDIREIGISYKWGHYSCNMSNVHGSEQRRFEVKSSACLVNRNLKNVQYMPLLLTDDGSWPKWDTTKYYSVVNPEEEIKFTCPSHKGAPNVFQKFPKQTELKAFCNKEDTFFVDGTLYNITDLQCSVSIEPSIIRKKEKCLTEKSELIGVGYNVGGFLEIYEVCYDHATDMPLYSRVLMTASDGSLNPAHSWYKYPGIGDKKVDKEFTCKDSLSKCCYSKSQLVNARDFSYDPEKYSTFIDPLNVVPVWRPCRNTRNSSWDDIQELVRMRLKIYDEFIVWSGTHTNHGEVIPRYLWKVLRLDEDEAVAVVYVNDPSPTEKDIKCENICTEEYWFAPKDEYTYCCSLPDFLKAFDLSGTEVGEPMDLEHLTT